MRVMTIVTCLKSAWRALNECQAPVVKTPAITAW